MACQCQCVDYQVVVVRLNPMPLSPMSPIRPILWLPRALGAGLGTVETTDPGGRTRKWQETKTQNRLLALFQKTDL